MSQDEETRLIMSNVPVRFIRWTPHGLVYTGIGSEEKLSHLNRGMVRRLVQEGILDIQGYRPVWVDSNGTDAGE